jgi:hypothetical protein
MSEFKIAAVMLIVAGVSLLGFWVIHSHFEARAFNHLTGKHVSTWDAMWVELRVQEPSK